uniref:Putative secreted protein n=1 Tax=Ixodes ricinus TaxID=34613 RepID=A0A6B0U5N0_IXORI
MMYAGVVVGIISTVSCKCFCAFLVRVRKGFVCYQQAAGGVKSFMCHSLSHTSHTYLNEFFTMSISKVQVELALLLSFTV